VLRSRTFRLVLVVLVVVAAAALALTYIPSDHYIVLPDRARPTDPLVDVPGEQNARGDGGIYMVDVRIGRANLFERLFPGLQEGAELLPERVINPEGVSDTQRRRSSLNEMSRSQLIAITVALQELGEDVDIEAMGAEVVLVQPDAPADGELEVGDVIVAAEGEDVTSISELQRAMSDLTPGDQASLTVERGEGERVDLTLGTRASDQDPDRAVVGVQVQNAEDFRFPVDIEIDAGSIGGPSAGLAFALNIVDELGDDLDRGRTIVATGELTLEGDVLPIGGVKQKVIGAREAGADLFLVPDRNAAAAREAADGLEIVAVSDLDEALSVLAAA
jgi:PDZ domain-containing protein